MVFEEPSSEPWPVCGRTLVRQSSLLHYCTLRLNPHHASPPPCRCCCCHCTLTMAESAHGLPADIARELERVAVRAPEQHDRLPALS